MITIPGRDGHMLFSISRSMIAWRGRAGAWIMVKPPWNKPLFSERNGGTETLKSWRGWRLLRRPA